MDEGIYFVVLGSIVFRNGRVMGCSSGSIGSCCSNCRGWVRGVGVVVYVKVENGFRLKEVCILNYIELCWEVFENEFIVKDLCRVLRLLDRC